MKKLCYALLFLLIAFKSFSQETEKLPKEPWEEIVEINGQRYSLLKKWNSDIKVQLEGNYTTTDSLNITKVLAKLNAITESINIGFSKDEIANLKISFIDANVNERDKYGEMLRMFSKDQKGFTKGKLYIYSSKSNPNFNNSLESTISKALVGGFFSPLFQNKRNSIFNRAVNYNNSKIPLNAKDIAIIKEAYKPDFEKKLQIANKQFKHILDDLYTKKVKARDRNLWWVTNPVALIFLPALILSLFFIFLISKIKKSIDLKIKRDWLRFGVIALISLFFMSIVIILCVSFYDFLTIPDDYDKAPIIRLDTILSTTVSLYLVLFPLLYLFRFIELKIQKTLKSIFTKTALIFLSTGFLPFICTVLLFGIVINHKGSSVNIQGDYLTLSKIFLFLMAIASIRALISFFIFKERNLIIENETKLSNLRELKTKAELKSLQSQINPHFLYNALNSIASLAHTNADKTEKMALSLSDLFKYTINRKGKKTSTVNDELEMVRSYLEIEQTRFGDRLEFVINVKEDMLQVEIPMFLLQPLVENAVKHGVSKVEDKGVIKLNIIKTDKGLEIEVIDNGPDFPEGLVSGHGLQTVHDLLRLSYGDKASLKWQNTPQKSISISIDKTA
ncbi:sensor histidine kinase [Thalassobellus suaedae]|uniref:Histidine kinase n=1 Tax=Thalassobellus suaedae TaxID=3074124 RepID=A0ABY9XS06_9FLAO|nr:histidine kinase [Flavobacteriaceae bacterium HL-DH14]